jgi:hypothetical protein
MADDDDGWKLPAAPRADSSSAFGAGDAFGARRRRPGGRALRGGVVLVIVIVAANVVAFGIAGHHSSGGHGHAVITSVPAVAVTTPTVVHVHKVVHVHTKHTTKPAPAAPDGTLTDAQFVRQATNICADAISGLESDAQDSSVTGGGLLVADISDFQDQLQQLHPPIGDEGAFTLALSDLDSALADAAAPDSGNLDGDLQGFSEQMALAGVPECGT